MPGGGEGGADGALEAGRFPAGELVGEGLGGRGRGRRGHVAHAGQVGLQPAPHLRVGVRVRADARDVAEADARAGREDERHGDDDLGDDDERVTDREPVSVAGTPPSTEFSMGTHPTSAAPLRTASMVASTLENAWAGASPTTVRRAASEKVPTGPKNA